MSDFPSHARAVIIGGGIIGCSTAYHLAKLGWKDTVIVERHKLTSGSTWHAAGLVGQLRSSANITQLLKNSVELYNRLEQETGLATGWKMNGGLRLACNQERFTEIKRQATTAHSFGLEMQILTAQEAQKLWPVMDISDVVGAAFLPTDGQANPADIAQSLAKGARQNGVQIHEETAATGIVIEKGRAVGVITDKGTIRCEVVINCAGQWAREIGQLAGVSVPLTSIQHQYIVTEPMAGVPKNLPTLRDPDRLIYFKEEVGGLVMGGYEHNPIPWQPNGARGGLPGNFAFQLLENNWDHFEPLMEQAMARVPALQTAGVKQMINGPESFTPDGNFILGEAPELKNFFVGAGFNAFGIASGGGAGRALAEWVAAGEPPMDLWPVDIRRFGSVHRDKNWVLTRTLEAYAHHYSMAWPHEELESGRPVRTSPLYQRLKNQGAVFGWKLGWERPNWFAPAELRQSGAEPKDIYTYGRQNWFDQVGQEHKAARERVVLIDQTSFAKFLLVGKDAEAAMGWICANDVVKKPGSIIYTQMLNSRGGIECDLTVTRLDDDAYYIVTGTGYATHDFNWISRHIPEGLEARLIDVTSAYGVLSLMGPKSRDVLQALTTDDLTNAAFPFGQSREILVAGAPVRALRVTYVGELGWELHVPTDALAAVYDALMQAGAPHGIANAGYRAIESLRLEKFYRAWSSDISPDHSPLEAGMSWAVKLKKQMPFLGREALVAQAAKKLPKLLACFTVDDPSIVLLGRETIFRNSKQVGWLASGGFGYTLNTNIGIGYVRNPKDGVTTEDVLSGSYELEIACQLYPAKVSLQPLYDPQNLRVKA